MITRCASSRRLTVSNDSSIDNEGQQSHLVGSSVVRQQSRSIVVADGHVGWSLSNSGANGGCNGKRLEEHDE